MRLRGCDVLFLVLWALMTIAMGFLFLPVLVSRTATQNVARHWAASTLVLLKRLSGITSQMRGYPNVSKTPVIYAAKHQSAWDTFMLWSVLGNPAFVLKRELYLIPVFGWYLWRSGQIAINRRDGKRAIASMIEQTNRYAAQGRSVVIFPEGTRRTPGAAPHYKMGVAHLSAETGLAVVPVALNAGRFWPKRVVKKASGNAVIEFLPHMPAAGSAKDAWMGDLEQRIEKATAKLLEQE